MPPPFTSVSSPATCCNSSSSDSDTFYAYFGAAIGVLVVIFGAVVCYYQRRKKQQVHGDPPKLLQEQLTELHTQEKIMNGDEEAAVKGNGNMEDSSGYVVEISQATLVAEDVSPKSAAMPLTDV
eukprot:gene18930-22620_t